MACGNTQQVSAVIMNAVSPMPKDQFAFNLKFLISNFDILKLGWVSELKH